AGADALDLGRARRELLALQCLGDDRAARRLDGNGPEAGLALLDHFSDAGNGAAGADAGDQNVRLAVRIVPGLFRDFSTLYLTVGGIMKWINNNIIVYGPQPLIRLETSPAHALFPRRQDQFGSKGSQESAALEAIGFRHGNDQSVTAGRARERQADPGVAARR